MQRDCMSKAWNPLKSFVHGLDFRERSWGGFNLRIWMEPPSDMGGASIMEELKQALFLPI